MKGLRPLRGGDGAGYRVEIKALLALALPLALSQGGQALMGLVDIAVVGHVDAATQTGVGLGNGLFFAVSILGVGTVLGLDPLIAQALGAGHGQRARAWMWQGIWTALGVSVVVALPLLGVPWALTHARIPGDVVQQARRFLFWRIPGLPAVLLFFVQRAYLQAAGRARVLVGVTAFANVLNLGLDLLFVFGGASLPGVLGPLRGVPAMGSAGAALATDLCSLAELGILGWAIARVRVEGGMPARAPRRSEVRSVLRVGIPVGMHLFLESGVFTVAGLLAARMGEVPGAAHQIVLNLCSVTFTVALGIGMAGSVRVGYAVGARDTAGVRRSGLTAFAVGTCFMACSALCLATFPALLTSLMTGDANVARAAVPLMLPAAIFQISDGAQGIGGGVLRGVGDSQFTFVANLLGHYGVGLPVTLFLAVVLGWGVVGIWWGLCAGLTAVAVTLYLRFRRLSTGPIEPLA